MPTNPAPALENYWAEFEVTDDDLDFIYNLLLERELPLTAEEMTQPLVLHRLELLEKNRESETAGDLPAYTPGAEYKVGDKLIFQAVGNRIATVTEIRPGTNPDLAPFKVIKVAFNGDGDSDGELKEFAAGFEDHVLDEPPEVVPEEEADRTPTALIEKYGPRIGGQVEARLEESPDIVRIANRWFHSGLLADINEGHLNLAEAVLDVSEGGPLPTSSMMEHMELSLGLDPLLTEFSVDYALQEDKRFDEVGPAGKMLWFLKRLEPEPVLQTPKHLIEKKQTYDRSRLTDDLIDLERSLDDELSDEEPVQRADQQEVLLSLLFPHWRVGSLPLSRRLERLFPTAYEAPRIRFILVDGHSGEKFPGWVVRKERYVYGLEDWYRRYEVPPGGLVRIKASEVGGEVVVEALERRQRNDWLRTVAIDDSGRIGFTVLKHPVGTAYDERMIVSVMDSDALDEAWATGDQKKMPLDRLVRQVFRELSKLNPQATVHAKGLYSAVNVIQRIAPGPIFAQLVSQSHYSYVGDLYWKLEEAATRE